MGSLDLNGLWTTISIGLIRYLAHLQVYGAKSGIRDRHEKYKAKNWISFKLGSSSESNYIWFPLRTLLNFTDL